MPVFGRFPGGSAAAPAAVFVQQEDLPAGLACRAMTGLVIALFDAG
ncbi:hypothetical protein HJB79_25385 [Rhizobium lentis]|nr:hypothetical protein [Rhizobium lentis]MBX5136383.1 hypothetical protein [Rhizobium lentis]MBX5142066.1 hypothetical protein [Rhizobium lentis]MBX5154247.1 hypothetical protein [Rhizobium lentis]MBX5179716.1 hypothetical protein [Rhizobium lentis]